MNAAAATAAPEGITVKRWRCPFCRRSWAHKGAAAGHVARCWSNPDVGACKTCAHFTSWPSGGQCFPGHPCDCSDGGEECVMGVDLSDGLKSGCPLWRAVTA